MGRKYGCRAEILVAAFAHFDCLRGCRCMTQPIPKIILLLVLGLASACGPSAENEIQYWNNNQKTIADLGEKWPGFKTHLENKLASAKPAWEKATKIAEEKQKAEQMKAANAMLNPLLSKIEQVKFMSESLKSRIEDLGRLKLAKPQHITRNDAVTKGYEELGNIEIRMASARPGTEDQAIKVIDEQISELISARSAVDRAYNNVKPKKVKKSKSRKRR